MKIRKNDILLILCLTLTVLLIAFSSLAKEGAINGISMCENIVIPSLFPILIIFDFICTSKISQPVENFFAPFTEKILKLPGCTAGVILFGLTGGYPAGALLTNSLYENEDIDKETAERLLLFNVNGGVGFIVNAVGCTLLNSQRAGLILFSSATLSALLIAAANGFYHKKNINSNRTTIYTQSPAKALNESILKAINSVLNLSAYIILFSAILNIFPINKNIMPFFEITGGLIENIKNQSLPLTAFQLAFGGICIHLQLLPIIIKVKLNYLKFLCFRLIHGGMAYFICKLLLLAFPVQEAVFSNYSEITYEISSINFTFSVLMILGCIVLIFQTKNKIA